MSVGECLCVSAEKLHRRIGLTTTPCTMLGFACRAKSLIRSSTVPKKPSRRSHNTNVAFLEKSVDLNSIVAQFGGPGENRLKNMIFLHGLFGSGANWRGIASAIQPRVRSESCSARIHSPCAFADLFQ
jgi:hypothetical protein